MKLNHHVKFRYDVQVQPWSCGRGRVKGRRCRGTARRDEVDVLFTSSADPLDEEPTYVIGSLEVEVDEV